MTALETWISTDTRPPFAILRSNLWHGSPDEAWGPVFEKLEAWSQDPATLADDRFEPPSRATIRLAIEVAKHCSTQLSPPTRVMPNGDAGIVLEWCLGSRRRTWEIEPNQRCEITHFVDRQLIDRVAFDLSGQSPS